MNDVFMSIRGRVLVNVEALNMTESVGNYVKHRRVPVIMPEGGYTTYFVPAISGESIAHGFQEVLAEEAKKKNLPVCKLCERGIFLKSTNSNVMFSAFPDSRSPTLLRINIEYWNKLVEIKKKKDKDRSNEEKELLQRFENNELPHSLEKTVVQNCVVEDVGGFLYAENNFEGFNIGGVKRTSNFFTGYMVPVKEALEGVVIEPQLHSRYALGTPFVEGGQGQMIYYVELSSAVYTFSFDLDTRYIGKTTFSYEKAGNDVVENRAERVDAALDAVKKFLIEFAFGAKKTRFLPVLDWESLIIAVSDDVWTVPSPYTKNYIENTNRKKEKVDYNTELFLYPENGSFEEVVVDAVDKAKERVGGA